MAVALSQRRRRRENDCKGKRTAHRQAQCWPERPQPPQQDPPEYERCSTSEARWDE